MFDDTKIERNFGDVEWICNSGLSKSDLWTFYVILSLLRVISYFRGCSNGPKVEIGVMWRRLVVKLSPLNFRGRFPELQNIVL